MTTHSIRTNIWLEEPEADNPFATRSAYCYGYDVYGEMLGNANWADIIYLMFQGEAPTLQQSKLLQSLAVALANAGPRDAAIHAAMCGGVGGSTSASCLMAALAVGAGRLGGGQEVSLAMEVWLNCKTDIHSFKNQLTKPKDSSISIWPDSEHPPGFDPYGASTSTVVKQTLSCLAKLSPRGYLEWLQTNRITLEEVAGHPLSLIGVAAAAFMDLAFDPEQGEMLFLLLRLPGAAVHALEQRKYGHKKFPFFDIELQTNHPKPTTQLKEAA